MKTQITRCPRCGKKPLTLHFILDSWHGTVDACCLHCERLIVSRIMSAGEFMEDNYHKLQIHLCNPKSIIGEA